MALSKGTMFEPSVVAELVNKVRGKSTLAKLSQQVPVPFNGMKEFVFSLDKEVDIVAEGGKKSEGGINVEPITIVPIKFEYGARVSDEFMYASEEEQLNVLEAFTDGFAKKIASGMDTAAFHGFNPRTGTASTVVGNNNFDSKVNQTVTYEATSVDQNIEDATALVEGSEADVTGLAMAPAVRAALAKLPGANGGKLYPELAWGGNPDTINGLPSDVNRTVAGGKDMAIVGDFANMFKWGYAKEIPLEVIQYGDPDNSGKDLKGYNQVYLRAEMYVGWGILNPSAFARIVTE